jgi:ankyrin repeat protein
MTLYELFINPHDQDGTTPFNSAAQEGHTEIIKLLLDKGANIEAMSPVQYPIHLILLYCVSLLQTSYHSICIIFYCI